jgi:Tfp pilus assembly protein PilN
MRAVNLLPQEATRERRAGLPNTLPLVGAAAVPVIALSLVVVGYSQEHSIARTKRGELAALRAEVAKAVPATAPTLPDVSGLVSARAQRLTALEDVLGKQLPWDTTLRELARALPANVWLTDLTATSPTPADSTAPPPTAGSTPTPPSTPTTSFTIDGYTYAQDDVAALLERLQLLPSLSNVSLASSARATIGKQSLVQFQVTAVVQPPHQADRR